MSKGVRGLNQGMRESEGQVRFEGVRGSSQDLRESEGPVMV